MDESVLLWINQDWAHPLLDGLFWWVSQRSSFAFPLIALLLCDSIRRSGWAGARLFLAMAITVGVSDALGNLLKDLFAEPRPCYVIYEQLRHWSGLIHQCGAAKTGMPSNHTINFFAAATFIALTTTWQRWRLGLFTIALLVGLSRIYLGKHYPGQVLSGAIIGIIMGGLGASLAYRYRIQLTNVPDFTPTSAISKHVNPTVMKTNPAAVASNAPPHRLSIVVPLYNEMDNVEPLLTGIHQVLADYPHPWELIVVNDGSSDETAERLHTATTHYGSYIRTLHLQRNFGQTAAMQAGIDAARGDVIATLDGDLQNDPADIPRMVGRLLNENLDLIVGWRKHRKDNVWLRTIPSRIANQLIGKITGVQLHDYGCSLKIYRAAIIKDMRLYGEMHRFIPAWISVHTPPQKIREEVVNHRARIHGKSKYGISRTFRVVLDLLSVYFFLRFLTRPGHFFGQIGLATGGLGGLILLYLLAQKIFLGAHIGTRPLLLVGVLLVLMAVQFLTTGILSEIITRTYFASNGSRSYIIRASQEPIIEAIWKEPHG